MSAFRAFGKKQYGPWSDPRLPHELREPYSSWSWAESDQYGMPLKRPTSEIIAGLFLLALALFPLVLVLAVADSKTKNAGLVVSVIALVVLLPPALYFLRVGSMRRSWVRRVKRVTGMSPFKMNSKKIPPPGCETPLQPPR